MTTHELLPILIQNVNGVLSVRYSTPSPGLCTGTVTAWSSFRILSTHELLPILIQHMNGILSKSVTALCHLAAHGDSNSVVEFPNCEHTWTAADTDTAHEWRLVEGRYSTLSPGPLYGDSNSVMESPNCDHTWTAADIDTEYYWYSGPIYKTVTIVGLSYNIASCEMTITIRQILWQS